MLTFTLYKRTISVQFYLRLAASNKRGYCPVCMTLRWHGQELQMDAGVLVLPERLGPHGQGVEALWDTKAQRAMDGRKLTVKEMVTVHTHPDTATNINAHLMSAGTLLKQMSNGNKALAKLVLGHADEDVTDRYAKDKAQLLAPAVLDAWRAVLGEWYDGEPVR